MVSHVNHWLDALGIKHTIEPEIDKCLLNSHEKMLWKVYFEYGRFSEKYREYYEALNHYEKCIVIFKDVVDKIKYESFKKSYLNRPDRHAVFSAVNALYARNKEGFFTK